MSLKSTVSFGQIYLQKQPPEFICRSSHQRCSIVKDVLGNFTKFTGKHLCKSLFFDKVVGLWGETCNFIKKETLAQVFSCEFCEISKNTFFTEHLRMTASASVLTTKSVFLFVYLVKFDCNNKRHFLTTNNPYNSTFPSFNIFIFTEEDDTSINNEDKRFS